MKTITKKQAKKLFNVGENVYFMPSKLPPYVIFSPCVISKKDTNNFDDYILWYEKTYCKKSVGKKVRFYAFNY